MALDIWRAANKHVFEALLPELAKELGRPRTQVAKSGILPTEFPYQWVRVYYGERKQSAASICDFSFALPVIAPKKQAIGIFSQTTGYFMFNHLCIVAVRANEFAKRERVIWGPKQWWL
jgi:hypothetical protein